VKERFLAPRARGRNLADRFGPNGWRRGKPAASQRSVAALEMDAVMMMRAPMCAVFLVLYVMAFFAAVGMGGRAMMRGHRLP
jgi:hypothetical protein